MSSDIRSDRDLKKLAGRSKHVRRATFMNKFPDRVSWVYIKWQ